MIKFLKTLMLAATLTFASITAHAASYTFVGSWDVYNDAAPVWNSTPPNGPLAYTGTEAAALLFGGNASDYVISTIDNNVANINFTAWYDVIGFGGATFAQDYSNKYLGQFYGPTSGYDFGNPNTFASAFIRDNLQGDNAINFAFRINQVNAVPVPAAAWLFGTGLLGLAGLRRKVAA